MIKQDTVDKIFDTLQIEEVIGDFVDLKKRGTNLIGLCPFHNEKTPSFNVSVSKGIFKCFGCGEGGHAVDFVMKHEKYSYPEALRYIAKKYNIEVDEEELDPQQAVINDHRESLYIVTTWASSFFQDQLWNTEEGKTIGLSYFKERGYTDETVKKFDLGYSSQDWDSLTLKARQEGYDDQFLEETGLVVKKEDGKVYDRFRGRVLFPIRNLTGRVLGFGARTLHADKKVPKYVNSPESPIYHKSDVLYGLFLAKKSIVAADNCFLVEGYADVIAMHQAGVENVVSSSGTSLTHGQIRLISRFSKNVTLLFDGDAAGIKASLRGTDMLLEEGLNVNVILFDDGHDPDSYLKEFGSKRFQKYLEGNQQDFISFKTNILLQDSGNDPVKRAGVIRDIVESIALIPDQIKASVFIRECSKKLDIQERVLIAELNKIKLEYARKSTIQRAKPAEITPLPEEQQEQEDRHSGNNTDLQEQEIVRLLLHYGHLPAKWEKNPEVPIALILFTNLQDIEFHQPACKKIITIFFNYLDRQALPEPKIFIQHQDKEIANMAISLLSSPYTLSPNWNDDKRQIHVTSEVDNLKDTVVKAIHRMKKRVIESHIQQIREELKIETNVDNIAILTNKYQKYKRLEKEILSYLGTVIVK